MKLTIGVLFGGESVEHEISIISAVQAMEALDKTAYQVVPIYVSKDKILYSGDALFNLSSYKDLKQLTQNLTPVYLVKINQSVWLKPVKSSLFFKAKTIDVMLPVVHGTNSEDGTVAGYCKMLDLPFVGSDVMVAGVGQDKVFFKHILENSKLPIVPWFWFYGDNYNHNKVSIVTKAKEIGYPLIVKPASLGSSIGINTANNERELFDSIEVAMHYDHKILVEKKIESLKEVNCSIIYVKEAYQASTVEEVVKTDEILSYKDKYAGQDKTGSKGMASTTRIIPAHLDETQLKKVQQLAISTAEILGIGGVVRIDFLIDQNNNKLYVNEINTVPGSLSFYLWKHDGIHFSVLLDMLIDGAIAKVRKQEKTISSYDTNILASFKKRGTKG